MILGLRLAPGTRLTRLPDLSSTGERQKREDSTGAVLLVLKGGGSTTERGRVVADERWIAVSTALTKTAHKLHPRATGEHACSAFAWIDLIGMAEWEEPDRGTLNASVRFLAQRWNWSKSRTDRFLVQLEQDGRIFRATMTGKSPGRITIANYEQYQHERDSQRDSKVVTAEEDTVKSGTVSGTLPPSSDESLDLPPESRDSKWDTEVLIPEVLPPKSGTVSGTKDTGTDNGNGIPETANSAVSGAKANELLGYWISHFELHELSEIDKSKQGAAAKRICKGRTSEQVRLAWRGMLLTFPFSKGDGFDLFDMERLFSKAVATAIGQDPTMRVSRLADRLRQTEREEDHARS
jgi:hypothetical protein